jgi:hypothetical protein
LWTKIRVGRVIASSFKEYLGGVSQLAARRRTSGAARSPFGPSSYGVSGNPSLKPAKKNKKTLDSVKGTVFYYDQCNQKPIEHL